MLIFIIHLPGAFNNYLADVLPYERKKIPSLCVTFLKPVACSLIPKISLFYDSKPAG
jgi:hypothetical protein